MTVNVKITETDVFNKLLEVCSDFANDEEIPANKRKQFVDRLLEFGALPE